MAEPRTHYQISLTAGQAVGLFVGLLAALGVAFFFGLMAGLSGRSPANAGEPGPVAVAERGDAGVSEPTPAIVPAPATSSSAPSRTELAGGAPGPEPTAPSTLRPFEDGAGEEPFPAPVAGQAADSATSKAPAKAAVAAARPPAAAPPGKVWVQVASLSSHDEASALSAMLSKHGFHTVVLSGSGSKGSRIYRVRVGPYRTEEEAGKAAARLTRNEKVKEPWVVPEGK